MGFLSRLFKKVEKANKNEISPEELEESLHMDETSLQDEILDKWAEMAENIIVNSVKATNNSVERAFVLIDFKSPSFDIFYQIDGQLRYWYELQETEVKNRIEKQLLPQADEVTGHINHLFDHANMERIGYAQLQFEEASLAWFSHIIWSSDEDASLEKDVILNNWFHLLKDYTKNQPLDSDEKLPWYP